jgi:hypothetical protein
MGVREQIEKRIENKRQENIGLEDLIRANEAFIAGLQEALKLMPKEAAQERSPEQILRPGSVMAKVRDLLNERREPLYINDILKGIGKEMSKKNRISIGGSLGNYVRRNEIFTRPAPNTYGLLEFEIEIDDKDTQTSINEEDEPPEGFGAPPSVPIKEGKIPW